MPTLMSFLENPTMKLFTHIETRIPLRKIEYDLPKRIYENAEERFSDTEKNNVIFI